MGVGGGDGVGVGGVGVGGGDSDSSQAACRPSAPQGDISTSGPSIPSVLSEAAASLAPGTSTSGPSIPTLTFHASLAAEAGDEEEDWELPEEAEEEQDWELPEEAEEEPYWDLPEEAEEAEEEELPEEAEWWTLAPVSVQEAQLAGGVPRQPFPFPDLSGYPALPRSPRRGPAVPDDLDDPYYPYIIWRR